MSEERRRQLERLANYLCGIDVKDLGSLRERMPEIVEKVNEVYTSDNPNNPARVREFYEAAKGNIEEVPKALSRLENYLIK